MKYRPKINCLIPNPTDATSFYRAVGPLSKLKYHIDCEFHFQTSISWATLAWFDILFIQRPWGEAYHKACEIALSNKIPIWIDFDDDLLDIPDWNPAKKVYSKEKDKELMIEMLKNATVVTTTTKYLQTKFLQYNSNVIVIPNALDDYLFKLEDLSSRKKNKVIINWRGSSTHLEDLRSVMKALMSVQSHLDKMGLDYMFHFIGENSDILKGLLRFKQTNSMDPILYFHFIKELNPTIQIVPLIDIPFNHAKSNIAWLEGIYSGAICLAPSYLEEFKKPGCYFYKDESEFKDILNFLCFRDNTEDYLEGYEYLRKNLLLSIVNEKRKEVVQELLNVNKKN